jgi:hypothetical protein
MAVAQAAAVEREVESARRRAEKVDQAMLDQQDQAVSGKDKP